MIKTSQSKNDRFRISCKRGGFVMALMLCTVVLVLIIGAGVLSFGLHSRGFAARNSSEIAARSAADAGLTKAFLEMNQKLQVKPWDDSSLPQVTGEMLPNSHASYSYIVTGDLGTNYDIKSTGKHGPSERIINCSLALKGPFEHAILSQGPLILKMGTLVQGYNSKDPWDTDTNVQVATQSTEPESMVLYAGVIVDGDVGVGVGGNVDTVIKDLGALTDRRFALTQEIDTPPIIPPELSYISSKLDVHGSTLTIDPGDTGEYGAIEVRRNVNPGTLEVNGGDVTLYITGDIRLGQDCEIVITDGSTLVLYLDGDFIADNDAGINNQNDPTSLTIYGTSTDDQILMLKAKSEALGAIYAPNGIVTIVAYSDVRGSVTAKSFEMKSGGNFYYDKALRDVGIDDDAVRFVITQWSEE